VPWDRERLLEGRVRETWYRGEKVFDIEGVDDARNDH
jgi:hypothetical protein